jgi:hypothetical protein
VASVLPLLPARGIKNDFIIMKEGALEAVPIF